MTQKKTLISEHLNEISKNLGLFLPKYDNFMLIGDLNPFVPNAPFLYPLKTSEDLTFSFCFEGSRERVHWERMG